MSKFINPFTDWGFKYLFGQEINKDCLINFLNGLLAGERHITDLAFHDKEQLPETRDRRGMIFDIYCTTDTGEEIIVEMQNDYQHNFVNRSIYYSARSIISQSRRSTEWRYDMRPVYTVCLMNFGAHQGTPHKFRTDVVLADRDTGEVVSGNMRIIYLMLPLFEKKTEDECGSDFDCWIYVLKNMEILDRMPFTARDAIFKKLEEVASVAQLHDEELERYEESLKILRDENNIRLTAVEEGLAKGMAKGLAKGLAKGMAKGMEQEKTDTIRRLLAAGAGMDVMVMATGWSAEEIKKVITTLN